MKVERRAQLRRKRRRKRKTLMMKATRGRKKVEKMKRRKRLRRKTEKIKKMNAIKGNACCHRRTSGAPLSNETLRPAKILQPIRQNEMKA